MPKSVHMHVKNFTCIASIMHVKFDVHMHDKIVSHVWKDFTCNKMHGKKVHTHDKNFSHLLQNFTRMSKSSHACEMLMWWTCIFADIDFTWFLFFTHFSHPFDMIFTHIALVVSMTFLLFAPASTKWLGWRKDRTSPRDRLGRFCDIYCAVILRHSFALRVISDILWSSCFSESYGPKF